MPSRTRPRPLGSRPRAGREDPLADPLDRLVVGGEEAVVLALEVLVEVTLGDAGAFADHRNRGPVVATLLQALGKRDMQSFALVLRDELTGKAMAATGQSFH